MPDPARIIRCAIVPMHSAHSGPPRRAVGDIAADLTDGERSLLAYFRAVSYGAVEFEVWSAADWHHAGAARHTADFARAAPDVPGLDLARFDHLIVVVPAHPAESPGRFRPMGALSALEVGGHPVWAGVSIIEDGPLGVVRPGEPSDRYAGALRHELVHAWFGLGHTGRMICTDQLGRPVPYHPVNQKIETGGVKAGGITMGTGRFFDVVQATVAGFIDPEDERVRTITAAGTSEIEIQALSVPERGVKTVRLPVGPTGGAPHVWMEYRRPIGFDADLFEHRRSGLPGAQLIDLDGLLFYTDGVEQPGHGHLSSILLDMTPGTQRARDDWRVTALHAGRAFIEPVHGTKVEVLETGPTSCRVRVTAGGVA
ncbi:MAG: hypothetical protein HKN62_05570 [Phycisphaerales bacterium]|nr:hypothetical protein [Phycisphaerales bacterium]